MSQLRLPARPQFGSGPTTKRPGYSLEGLNTATQGRSHRSVLGRGQLSKAIELSRSLLGLPDSHKLAIVPGSDTGAMEMAMWNLLGPRPVDVFFWEYFGAVWATDLQSLGVEHRSFTAPYGQLPDLSQADPSHDIIFTSNGTTSGVWVPNFDWISDERTGLTFCDATSGIFSMEMAWDKLDVVTYSWQKALGGEAAHGVLILGPRAIQRLAEHKPTWPVPKLLRLPAVGKDLDELANGNVINTPSMLVIEDVIDAMQWAVSIGGLPALIKRSTQNYQVLEDFVNSEGWIVFLTEDSRIRSHTGVTLQLPAASPAQVTAIVKQLEATGAAYDIAAYRSAPPGLRIWCGPTVDSEDLQLLLPHLKSAYQQVVLK